LIFLRKKPERTVADELKEITIKAFRGLGQANGGIPPTKRTSDEDILKIYQEVVNAYKEVEGLRNERIPATSLNVIAMHFFKVFETQGEIFYKEHLEYEINKYIEKGLRDYQTQGVELF